MMTRKLRFKFLDFKNLGNDFHLKPWRKKIPETIFF
jgi:hypothetical protein